jgi:hypothetical protein
MYGALTLYLDILCPYIKLNCYIVIPAQAGIQKIMFLLDSRFHGNDGFAIFRLIEVSHRDIYK